jgi:L-rhamnose mutarotase
MQYCWTWTVKPERLEEYVQMHLNPWREIMEAHSAAGISNYSIYQDGNRFFYVFDCENPKKAFEYIDQNEACQRWNALTSQMVEGSFDFSEAEPIRFLPRVFYLK